MKTSRTTIRVAAALAGMALFLGAAAAAGIDRGKELSGTGTVITVPDVAPAAGSAETLR